MIEVKNAHIEYVYNRYSQKYDYLLYLSKETYDDFIRRGLKAKESCGRYWIRLQMHSFINNDDDYIYERVSDYLNNTSVTVNFDICARVMNDYVVTLCFVDVETGLKKEETKAPRMITDEEYQKILEMRRENSTNSSKNQKKDKVQTSKCPSKCWMTESFLRDIYESYQESLEENNK